MVEVSLVPVNGKKKVTIQCYVVDEISSIANARPEIFKETCPICLTFESQIFAGKSIHLKKTF